jgi:hypothetical protein
LIFLFSSSKVRENGNITQLNLKQYASGKCLISQEPKNTKGKIHNSGPLFSQFKVMFNASSKKYLDDVLNNESVPKIKEQVQAFKQGTKHALNFQYSFPSN